MFFFDTYDLGVALSLPGSHYVPTNNHSLPLYNHLPKPFDILMYSLWFSSDATHLPQQRWVTTAWKPQTHFHKINWHFRSATHLVNHKNQSSRVWGCPVFRVLPSVGSSSSTGRESFSTPLSIIWQSDAVWTRPWGHSRWVWAIPRLDSIGYDSEKRMRHGREDTVSTTSIDKWIDAWQVWVWVPSSGCMPHTPLYIEEDVRDNLNGSMLLVHECLYDCLLLTNGQ